jgi:hypothetical protein
VNSLAATRVNDDVTSAPIASRSAALPATGDGARYRASENARLGNIGSADEGEPSPLGVGILG